MKDGDDIKGGEPCALSEGAWALGALGPLDGRYRQQLSGLGGTFGEGGLIMHRLYVEAQWLIHLSELPMPGVGLKLSSAQKNRLLAIGPRGNNNLPAMLSVKTIENETSHDVKAVEYQLRNMLGELQEGASDAVLAMIHFGCTSEDINNLAYSLMLDHARTHRLIPLFDRLIKKLCEMIRSEAATPMLSRTHGQTASPTTMGKEMAVFAHRIKRQRDRMNAVEFEGKMSGAVGNYNAHTVAFPMINWPEVTRDFIEKKLRLKQNKLTTQIENHDSLVEFCEALAHGNTILIGLCRDIWSYISIGYFRQKIKTGEIGSSTMPHKVNPIDFENAEGNFGLSNALSRHFAEKLPISRWQRDLSDSTVMRSIGTMLGHTELALQSLLKGLDKISTDRERIHHDLHSAWEVLAEPLQTVLRQCGVNNAYERLKEKSRGQTFTKIEYLEVVDSSPELNSEQRNHLRTLSPDNYTGLAKELALSLLTKIESI